MLQNEQLSETKLKSAAELVPILGAFPLATFYLNRNNPAEALVWLKECLKADPGHVGAKLDMIDIYASDKNVEQLRKMLASDKPHNRDDQECSNYLKAVIALYEKRYKDVPPLLDAAPHILNRLGYQSMCLEARIALQDVYRIPENVITLTRLSNSVQIRQHVVDRLYPLLVDLVKQEKTIEADTIAAVLLPMMDGARFSAAVPTFKMLLLSAMKRNDYQRTMDYSSYLLRHDQEMPLANLTMGEALIAMKRPDKALAYLKAAPDSLSVFYDRARAYTILKDDHNAELAYRAAWEKFPGDIILFSAYADFLFAQQRFSEINPLIAGMPDSPDAKYAISTIKAKVADKAGDKKESVRLYSEALELLKTFPVSDENLYRQAYLYALTGQDAKAEPIYRQLLQKMPNSMIILLNLSEVEAALGNHQEAMMQAKAASLFYPDAQEVKDCLNRRKAEAAAAKSGI
jgi:Tfp pilus assembly protein PilF